MRTQTGRSLINEKAPQENSRREEALSCMWELTGREYRGDHEIHENSKIRTDYLKPGQDKRRSNSSKTQFQARPGNAIKKDEISKRKTKLAKSGGGQGNIHKTHLTSFLPPKRTK